jgi:hypothetical protein
MEVDHFGQLLARALLFRIIAEPMADPDSIAGHATTYAPAVDLAVRLIQDRR